MTPSTYLLTGATGLLGQCVLYELLEQHAQALDQVRIYCLGRRNRSGSLKTRIETALRGPSGTYFRTPIDLGAAMEAVVPVEGSLREEGLALDEVELRRLRERPPEHVLHVAALTDFRHGQRVEERLRETNQEGTKRLLALVDALPRAPRSFNFVSSAYSCGLTFGKIDPDYLNLEQRFQNPYQRSKLESERRVREHFRDSRTQLRVFRPSVIGGRLAREPRGFVTKFDVYLGWASFFLHAKRTMLGLDRWEAILDTPLEAPIRFAANPELGLNIVPSDFVAAVIVQAVLSEHSATSMHIAAARDLRNFEMMERMLSVVGASGHSYVRGIPEDLNPLEASYYQTAGALYTPYIDIDEPWVFDLTSLRSLCDAVGLELAGVSDVTDFDVMLDFAREHRWGL